MITENLPEEPRRASVLNGSEGATSAKSIGALSLYLARGPWMILSVWGSRTETCSPSREVTATSRCW